MKRIKFATLFFVFCLSVFPFTEVSGQEWKKIVPLKTNCEDLKKILEVKECNYPVSNYKFEKFSININFSRKDDGWNISSDTVIDATIILHELINLKDFEIDFTDYQIKPETDIPGLIYRNNKKGIQFTTQKPTGDEEYVMDVSLFPVKNNDKCNL